MDERKDQPLPPEANLAEADPAEADPAEANLVEANPTEENPAEASLVETTPAEAAPEEATSTGASPDEDVEEGEDERGKKKKKAGRYNYHISQESYFDLLMQVEEQSGREKKNRNTSMVFLVLALIPSLDAAFNPGGGIYGLIPVFAAIFCLMLGLFIRNQGRRKARRFTKVVPNGFSLSVAASSKGLKVQQAGQNGALVPYSTIQTVYDNGSFLSVINGPDTSIHIPKDTGNPNYRAIEEKLRQMLGGNYKKV